MPFISISCLCCTDWNVGLYPDKRWEQTFLPCLSLNPFCPCSVAQLCPTLYDPKDCSAPGFPVLRHLPELTQTPVWVGDAIQPSHPHPLLLLLSIFPSNRVFSSESVLLIRWSKYWSFSKLNPFTEILISVIILLLLRFLIGSFKNFLYNIL